MRRVLKTYWFLAGLVLIFVVTLTDPTGGLAASGRWLKSIHGPDIVIFLVFLLSGFLLDTDQISSGLTDITGTMAALFIIFIAAPVYAAGIGLVPFDTGIRIGLFLVAVMPTTLSSGVVMSGAAGGNPAHAMMITIVANIFSVFTISVTLPMLLKLSGLVAVVNLDHFAFMAKIGFYVLIPLCVGLGIKYISGIRDSRLSSSAVVANQCLILVIVWVGISQAKPVLMHDSIEIVPIVSLVVSFHLMLLVTAFAIVKLMKIRRGRMESIIFMGSQKTLPLSIILQVTLFPGYGQALIVCVLHHLGSLIIDGFLVGRLRSRRSSRCSSG